MVYSTAAIEHKLNLLITHNTDSFKFAKHIANISVLVQDVFDRSLNLLKQQSWIKLC